jgi:hypothetical protein
MDSWGRWVIVVAVTSIGGCAHVERAQLASQRNTVATPGEDIQCRSEHVTGSLIATRVCTTKSQREAIQQGTQAAHDFLDRQVIAACPGTPGCH